MIDVLLTHSNHLFNDRKQIEKMQPYPPLQTLLAAAALKQAGFTVALCDVTLESPEEKFTAMLRQYVPRLVVVCEDDFNFLTKMCLAPNRELSFWMAKMARERGYTIAVHGSDSSDHRITYLQAGFQYVLLGEPEQLLLALAAGKDPCEISGLSYISKATGALCQNPVSAPIACLDSLPQTAWDLVDVSGYRKAWVDAHGFFSLNMISSRGCPFRCNWCAKPIYGNSYRARSPRSVAEEMLFLKRSFQPDHLWFADDIFGLSARWAHAFSEEVKDLQAQIPFKMQSRCDLMTRDTVRALKTAGCCEVWMGAESGSQRILDAMEKGIDVEDICQARANLRRHDIRVGFFLQFGYPGETWEDIGATIRMVREARPDDVGISVTYPLPGTKLYQLVSTEMKKTAWSHSGDLAMMFRGRYPTAFYRSLAAALHLEVRQPTKEREIRLAWDEVRELETGSLQPAVGVPS